MNERMNEFMANKGKRSDGAGSGDNGDDDVSTTTMRMVFEKWNGAGATKKYTSCRTLNEKKINKII